MGLLLRSWAQKPPLSERPLPSHMLGACRPRMLKGDALSQSGQRAVHRAAARLDYNPRIRCICYQGLSSKFPIALADFNKLN